MEQMQFSAVVLLTLLLLKLLLMPHKVVMNRVVGRARWLMTIGIALLDLHFLLQYTLRLRAMGVTQAVMLNLLLFIPSSWTISLAVLYLQRQGQISHFNKMLGGIVWAVALLLIGIAATIDGKPLFSDTRELHWAEVAVSIFYLAMQGYYSWNHYTNLRSMRLALQNYYDHDMDGMLVWMKFSILVLMVLAMMVPLLIFVERQELAIFGILFFVGIFYLVDTFCNYMVSSAPKKMERAEASENEAFTDPSKRRDKDTLSPTLSEEGEKCSPYSNLSEGEETSTPTRSLSLSTVHTSLVQKWIDRGGYRHSGLTMPAAAKEIGIPRYLLSAWLKQQGCTYAAWMTDLRIDEAKRVITEHPDWNNEAIANHCGFSDRTYFQKKFKEKTGLSPAEFIPRH